MEEIENQDRNIEILENQNATKDGEEEPKQYSKASSSRLPDKDPKKISPSAGIRVGRGLLQCKQTKHLSLAVLLSKMGQ